jgi:hypothetical protein
MDEEFRGIDSAYDTKPAKKATRFIEDDFQVLSELDERIDSLIQERYKRIDMINAQHYANAAKIQERTDWFEGTVRGNPVPERGEQAVNPDSFGKPRFGF